VLKAVVRPTAGDSFCDGFLADVSGGIRDGSAIHGLRAHRVEQTDTGVQAERSHGQAHRQPPDWVSPVIFSSLLCSYYEGRLAELQAGQAMQRALLAATGLRLSTSFLSQPIEVSGTRAELRRVMGGSLIPQTIARIGFGSPVPSTPRRPVGDLLMEPTRGGFLKSL
jgi:hypothetical protein